MTIKIEKNERFGYTVLFNDEVILECAGWDEIREATIDDLIGFAKDAEII